jgi:4-amino-4-deoxy-L-arabinose transferase-like glycosyltransferase
LTAVKQGNLRASRRRVLPTGKRLRQIGIYFVAAAMDRRLADRMVLAFIGLHIVLWTVFFTIATAGQDPHGDSLEAYAWGRQLAFGYGKHPPLSGWVARLWFSIFPAANWAMYALAMALTGTAIWASWRLALQVVERRRAILVVLLLLIYPIFNIRGSSVTPDTLQTPLFVFAVLIFVVAFQHRGTLWSVLLGLVCASALLTKYWALLLVGAVGLAAIVDPNRRSFFRSRVPYVAAAVCLVALGPHLIWLVNHNFAPIRYAGLYLTPRDISPIVKGTGALRHHFGMLIPVLLVTLWGVTHPRVYVPADCPVTRPDAARQIWVIAASLVVVPPVLAVIFGVYFVTDWGTPLYSFVPLAILAIPKLGVPLRSLIWTAWAWLIFALVAVAASPLVSFIEARSNPQKYVINGPALAAEVTRLWHERTQTALAIVAGPKPLVTAISFYSPDHPQIFTGFEPLVSPWINSADLKRSGFVAICGTPLDWYCKARVNALALSFSTVNIAPAPDRRISLFYRESYTLFIAVPEK